MAEIICRITEALDQIYEEERRRYQEEMNRLSQKGE